MGLPPEEEAAGSDIDAPPKWKGLVAEYTNEVSAEQVALASLEGRLADVRKALHHAARVRCAWRADVQALAGLAQDLHHRVAAAVFSEGKG
jgi:hypothetical protein